MEWLKNALDFIFGALLTEFVVVVVGVLFAAFIQNRWEKWKYGNWRVIVCQNERDLVDRDISPGKAKEILHEPADLSVFLKGVASPYGWINCDLLEEGRELGLLVEDKQNRRFVIDLDKNPARKSGREGAY